MPTEWSNCCTCVQLEGKTVTNLAGASWCGKSLDAVTKFANISPTLCYGRYSSGKNSDDISTYLTSISNIYELRY